MAGAEASRRARRKRGAALLAVGAIVAAGLAGAYAPLGLAPPAQAALAILLAAALLWITEAVPLFATSFVVLGLALVWLEPAMRAGGQEAAPQQFLAPFFSDVILLFLGGFTLSSALHRYRWDELLARRILLRARGSIPGLLLGLMGVTAFLSMWLSNTATAAMMLALAAPIARAMPHGDRQAKAIVLSIPFAANLGGVGTPIGSPPNAIALQYLHRAGVDVGFGKWMLLGVPGVVLMLAVLYVTLRVLFRGPALRVELPPPGPAPRRTPAAWVALAVSLLTALGWTTSAWHGLSAGTVALFPLAALFGGRVLDTRDLRELPWDVLLMMGGGLSLGVVMSESGLADRIVAALPVSGESTFALLGIFGVLACVMSSLMSNTATANLVIPILLGLQLDSLGPLLVGVAMTCSLAMPLPISTPPNAIAFGSGLIDVRDMVRPGLLVTAVGVLTALTLGYAWWRLVGLA